MEFFAQNLAPLMFAGLIIFLLMGFPVAFSLGACGLFFGFIGIELNVLPASLMQALPLRIFGIMKNDTLLAIPFFTLMGLILERSGMAEDLLDTIGQLFGPIRGGLAFAVIFVGALLAATTGVVAASVISMGLISLPIMLRYGYDRRIASGVIAASGTLAQIIPPSLVLIILADQLGKSVGDMYKGAFLPGFILTGLYTAFIIGVAIFRPKWVPALPLEARAIRESNGKSGLRSLGLLTFVSVAIAVYFGQHYADITSYFKGEVVASMPTDETIVVAMSVGVGVAFLASVVNKLLGLKLLSKMAERVTFVLIPPLGLIFLVLGTIFLGIATPTEGGAMGALGAFLMAAARGRITYKLMTQALTSTTKLSCFVVFILVGSTIFSLSFQGVDGPKWVEHLLTALPGGQIGFLIFVNLLIFVLAFFLDFFELSFIVVPLLAPVAEKLGINLIWFGVLLGVNMQTSFMHPPFGFALFYLRSVAPLTEYIDKLTGKKIAPVTTGQIYWGAVPFVLIQIVMVALIIAFPNLVSGGLGKVAEVDSSNVVIEAQPQSDKADTTEMDGNAVFGPADPPASAADSSNK
ncbi:TRAP transporter large permease subunit [Paucibacter sp. B2R-40]|uniref:TRAP transporter large permease n=1 Tax=Paucibacter sp. B2R-40 TaxID=2893554 RepID=UPI0021E39E69|nr:TRAP transporter large permease subunit [Paucibacter sp. B2R-40]MCV2355766.1 TRAP transporter large permease subunit [Paucibacter sp. B2R-40]